MKKITLGIDQVLDTLRVMLPDIAKRLIISRDDISDSVKKTFSDNCDNAFEHSPLWHQYGILTHSIEFQKIVVFEVPTLMKRWGIFDVTKSRLSEKIDGISKADLLQIASLLHDLGKFTTRTYDRLDDGTLRVNFDGHEADSGRIVRHELKNMLLELGLTMEQIEYIAVCAEHHFDLGRARKIAIDNGGYTIEYARSGIFRDVARNIISSNPDFSLEIGLMFIADSLSKTEIMAVADNDADILGQKPVLEQKIEAEALDPRLINQALQQPVNVEIGRQYLQVWADLQIV